ncbi:cytidylate kinase-like family protein [Puteibacter caeruleilacunae]|nr:cytidylate kinase-like family protein [Puteibacter caeruleilacunae]
MKSTLQAYLNKRMGIAEKRAIKSPSIPGPVLTISREPGCPGMKIANALQEILIEKEHKDWKVISKEILTESSKELDIHTDKVNKIFNIQERTVFDEILAAFSTKKFKNERVIKKTVTEVIRTFSENGHCIIVGRAGHIIASDIKKSLHVRLYAPLEWRVSRIMKSRNLSSDDARKYIIETEKQRMNFRTVIKGSRTSKGDFDLIINCAKLKPKDIAKLIAACMEATDLLVEHI